MGLLHSALACLGWLLNARERIAVHVTPIAAAAGACNLNTNMNGKATRDA
jgi:hypothetical protein